MIETFTRLQCIELQREIEALPRAERKARAGELGAIQRRLIALRAERRAQPQPAPKPKPPKPEPLPPAAAGPEVIVLRRPARRHVRPKPCSRSYASHVNRSRSPTCVQALPKPRGDTDEPGTLDCRARTSAPCTSHRVDFPRGAWRPALGCDARHVFGPRGLVATAGGRRWHTRNGNT